MTEYTPTKITPDRSAPLRFNGKLIAETEWEIKDKQGKRTGRWMYFEVWQTPAGAVIAVRKGEDAEGHGYTDAIVVDPTEAWQDSAKGHPPHCMVDAVLSFYDWHDRARSMVKSQLKWRMERVVP